MFYILILVYVNCFLIYFTVSFVLLDIFYFFIIYLLFISLLFSYRRTKSCWNQTSSALLVHHHLCSPNPSGNIRTQCSHHIYINECKILKNVLCFVKEKNMLKKKKNKVLSMLFFTQFWEHFLFEVLDIFINTLHQTY